MSETNELVRLVKPRSLPAGTMEVEASDAERAALAKRFGITAIHSLTAKVDFSEKDDAVIASGSFSATLEQPCAVTRDDFTYDISEDFSLRFVPAGRLGEYEEDAEFELTEEDLDEIEYEGETFDLGEAIAQELGLAIDPYREGPDADAIRAEANIESDEDRKPSGPLADALAALKRD
ncbi:MAG: YceD family protein [Qipengyuania vulgaris]